MDTLALPAPAKINLFLHVNGRRADGYHDIETLFQFLDRADRVELSARADGVIERAAGPAAVAPRDDLAVRAAHALKRHAGVAAGARIAVHKRVPMGGGLGGGSSDAATVLRGLDRLWGLDLGVDELSRIGLGLGADVPVFVRGRAAFARGVGERLEPVEPYESWYLVACPSVAVSTAAVFGAPSLTRDTPALTIAGFPWGLGEPAGLDRFWARTRNDCEAVVRASEPRVAAALDWLSRWGPARMTGTGACAFARFRERGDAEEALARAPAGLEAFVARGCNRSPLLDALDRCAPAP